LPILQGWKGRYSIFVPKAIIAALGWKDGDEILVEILPDRALKLKKAEERTRP